jgi:hypothetical protein
MTEQQQDEVTEVWVKTEWDVARYVVVLETSDGYKRTLTPDRALAYAAGLYTAVARAEHMAAIMRQMTETLGLTREDARDTVLGLHDDLPPLNHKATAPMMFHPAVGLQDGKTVPVVMTGLEKNDEPSGYWTIEQAKEHALGVLDAVEAANLDNAYYRSLVGSVGIDENRAHHAVADLVNHR